MASLRMKGVKLSSFEDFRENFDFTNAKDYLRQGRLSAWFREIGENAVADELDELKDTDYSDKTLMDNFIGIFSLPAEFSGSGRNTTKNHSKEVEAIRKKLESAEEPADFTVSCSSETVLELLDLLYGYFKDWSTALRRAPGKALSSNRWELYLSDMTEFVPFSRGIRLLDELTAHDDSSDLFELYDLPERIRWTTVSQPEQREKTKVIAAYGVCFFEFEYRLGFPAENLENTCTTDDCPMCTHNSFARKFSEALINCIVGK